MALGAMPDDEAALVETHLETCESCSAELAGFRETAALLGAVSAEVPPASLRRSIMAKIAVTPQLPPLTGEDGPAPTLRPPAPGTPAEPTPSAEPAGPQGLPDNVVPLRRWYRRPGALVAAAIAAVVIGGGTVVAINQATGPAQQIAQTPEQCVAQAADRQELTPEMGQGTVTYAASCNAVTLDVTGLPDLPQDKAYQLWAVAAGADPRSLGVLADASEGKPQLVTAPTRTGESVVAITTEPAGGSIAPTTDILWQATLNA